MANPSHDKGNVAAAVIAWWEENRPLGWAEEDHVAQATVNCETDAEQALARLAAQLVRATPPSPSTAPEVPPFPESFGLADVPHAMNTPDDWDADYRATWQKLQVAEINLSQMRAYARKLRAALASRPAEVDDEGLPAPAAWAVGKELFTCHDAIPFRLLPPIGQPEPLFTAEQYRQGQRDAVAADRARRGDINPEDAFVLYSAADVIDECGKVLVALKVRGIADRVIMPEITKAPR